MKPYRRILTLIDFDMQGEQVAKRALMLARLNQAKLAFLHLAEPDTALDGGYPVSSHKENLQALETASLRRLDFMAAQLGAGEAECHAQCGQARHTYKHFLKSWEPDLVISARELDFLSGPHDLLVLGQRGRHTGGGTLRRIASWLGAQLLPAAL